MIKPVRIKDVHIFTLLATMLLPFAAWSQRGELAPRELKKLSVEELMDVEVTLVSRTPEKLTEAASAIQVITGEDIRRSGATNIPDALRLVTNLQVAQLTSSAWIISSRGFNTVFANKLLVMIDGRTVYTPLFGGVIWEQQNVLLEDVDRIEVVSGPGGTLWGANAVNGVINIVTKNTRQTQGLYASVAAGDFIKDNAALRWGGRAGKKITYKIYGQHFDRKYTNNPNNSHNTDAWGLTQAGFRMDWNQTEKDAFLFQGDWYWGARKTAPSKSSLNGQNVIARWSHTISDRADLSLQVYYDRYFRKDIPTSSSDKLNTFDVDFQQRMPLGRHQNVLWGLGYRAVKDHATYDPVAIVGILPPEKNLDLFNAFIQDELRLAKSLRLTVGTKLLHNVYTGFEWQPSARLAWMKGKGTLWAAISRAVRTPSRFDVDYFLPTTPQPPTTPSVAGGPNFDSEKLLAYELGYRYQPIKKAAFSAAVFYNTYSNLYSVEPLPNTLTYQIQNGSKGRSWGVEFSGSYQVTEKWRLRGGYTYFDKDLESKPGHNFDPDYLGNDVKSQVLLQSILELPFHFQFDAVGRYLDVLRQTLATARVPAYATFDLRLAYVVKGFELALVGQNLAKKDHTEFGTLKMPRNYYVKISTRF